MTEHIQYALESAAWFLGGVAAASVFWRTYVHRVLVRSGHATREQPLALFVAFLVTTVSAVSVLFGEASRLKLDDFVTCQSHVNQANVQAINDRSASTIAQLQSEIDFYQSLLIPTSDPKKATVEKIDKQIAEDQQRITNIRTSPLQPITSCHKP